MYETDRMQMKVLSKATLIQNKPKLSRIIESRNANLSMMWIGKQAKLKQLDLVQAYLN